MKFIFVTLIMLFGLSQPVTKNAYVLFNEKGKAVDYDKLLNKAVKADIILFGELHNNPIVHWLQYELTKDLIDRVGDKLVLGAEMFEADNQVILDEYLKDIIGEKKFEDEARLWPNYKTDYKPLVTLAKENNLSFIATNVPRRYANVVYKKGLEGLEEVSDDAKKWIVPLPVEVDLQLPGYQEMLQMMGGGHGGQSDPANFPKSQALKDATMAHFILQNWKKRQTFIHYNGAFHSNNYEGIVWYLKKNNPKLKILTISSVEQTNVNELVDENKGLADFTICITETMTKTY